MLGDVIDVAFFTTGRHGDDHQVTDEPQYLDHNHRRHRMRTLVPVAVAALLAGGPAHAQDITNEIDEIFSSVPPDAPGCVVAVAKDGKQVVNRAYGLADIERDVPLSPATNFDIGSVQKQFIAAAVLLLVEEGRLSLSDDVREYLPELPDYGRMITVDHLLTHTSGVRDWIALARLSSADEDDLTMILRQRGLNFVPGEEWSYSNSGYVLLNELVERTAGMPFSEFSRTRLFEPLGMKMTRYADDLGNDVENRALAYEKDGDGWSLDVLVGNGRGALLTTAGDLLIWNEALTHARLGTFVTEKLQEPARLSNGRELGYGRGLFLDANRGGRVVWHSGGAGGYKAFLSRYPEQGLSIAILCNAGDSADRGAFARGIYDLFVPDTRPTGAEASAPAGPSAGAGATGVDVAGKAGLFFSERTGQPVRLIANDGRLDIAGGPRLVAVATDRFRNSGGGLFFMSEDEFELRFLSADEFELTSMEGQVTRYRRARPYSPTATDLAAFTGRYESDEMRAAFEMEPGNRGVLIRLNGSPAEGVEFAPMDTDTFQRGRWTLRFRRDGDGKVVGLDYSNPGLRNVPFIRASDGTNTRAPAPTEPSTTELSVYEGTYALQAPNRVIDLRVWVDAEGRLNGELVGLGQQTTFRPSTAHKFLHATQDDVWFLFTVENGRATSVTAHQRGREMSGWRKQ